MLLKKKIVLIALVCLCMLGYMVFSDEVDTRYTEFYFISGGNNYDTITVNLTGGETGTVIYGLDNKSTENFGLKISFVDASVTDDGNDLKVCLSENEIENFGQYVSTNPISFVVPNGNLTTGSIEMNFPAWFSGVYHGCVVYEPTTIENITHLNTVARKAIFLDVDVVPTATTFNVKVFPGSRSDQVTNNSNKGEIRIYDLDWNNVLYSGVVYTNNLGIGTYIEAIPSGLYNIVYRGQSHLASYLSGEEILEGLTSSFDFTTGVNLFDVDNLNTITDDGQKYQIAGDMDPMGLDTYDGYINGSDVSVMVLTQYNMPVDENHIVDLNNDGYFDIQDIGIVGINYQKGDMYYRETSLSW